MKTLDHQAIVDRVFKHFVTDGHPPGCVSGHVVYHQDDGTGRDRPCAIGLFDTHQLIDDEVFVNNLCPDVEDLYRDEPELLNEIFAVEEITTQDICFLSRLQRHHDDLGQKFEANLARFRDELTEALNRLADRYGLRPVAM